MRRPEDWSEMTAAALLPAAIALAARPRGDGLSAAGPFLAAWAGILVSGFVVLVLATPTGSLGPAARVGLTAAASTLAALAAVWVLERS